MEFDLMFCVFHRMLADATPGHGNSFRDDVGGVDLRLGSLENLEISISVSIVRVILV